LSLITDREPFEVTQQSTPVTLRKGEIHLWGFALSASPAFVTACREFLSPAECQRADRFIFERDRMYHTIAHALLRHLLGRYCNAAPAALQFIASPAGKPSLVGASLHFNLTHSSGRALLGVSATHELGIDLEQERQDIEALNISQHYFFGSERDDIANATPELRAQRFFRYWVAKEAVLKAQGIGLGFPLDRFRVAFNSAGDRAQVETLDPTLLSDLWRVRMLDCASINPTGGGAWQAAVVARGDDWFVTECS
jgi:4'-phosphopantetheinyl transferase